MKNLSEIVYEANQEDVVYAIYLEDGTLYNYYESKDLADKEADSLRKESKCNKPEIKQEPRKNFEK